MPDDTKDADIKAPGPETTPSAPALGFSITANINQKRQIVVQSFVPLDAEPKLIAQVLDKALDQIDRAESRYYLKDLKLSLVNDEKSLREHIERVADLQNSYIAEHQANGRKGEFELKGVQKTNVDNTRKTVEALKARVEQVKNQIAEHEAVIGG